MHKSTFEYLKPSESQIALMGDARAAAYGYARAIAAIVPDGPDKTYIFRKLREVAMWVNVAITRQADGTPRVDDPVTAKPITDADFAALTNLARDLTQSEETT